MHLRMAHDKSNRAASRDLKHTSQCASTLSTYARSKQPLQGNGIQPLNSGSQTNMGRNRPNNSVTILS